MGYRIYAYLRGKHLFEGVAYFIFQYFSLKIVFCETTTYFSINTQDSVCYDHVLSLELSIKTILKHYIQRSWVINIWSSDVPK